MLKTIQGGTLPICSPAELLYKLPASFTQDPALGITIVIHVPIITASLDLLHYQPLPIIINNSTEAMDILHHWTLLAINPTFHREVEEVDSRGAGAKIAIMCARRLKSFISRLAICA
jgi:hypothetical protein